MDALSSPTPLPASLTATLRDTLGPSGYVTDPDLIAPSLREWRGRWHGQTPCLLAPACTDEVAAIVRACAAHGVAITPQGGNTGLVGGQIPRGEVLLSTRRLNAIRHVDALDDSLIAEAGVVLSRVHEAAAGVDRSFPLSLASQGSATIGGLISTNAGGVHVLRFGMMRRLVLGMEAVLADGSVFHGLSSLRKDNTGYDLKQMLIGAEGTLGIVTAATLELYPRARAHQVVMCVLNGLDNAPRLLEAMKKATGALVAFELMNARTVELVLANIPGTRFPFAQVPQWTALLEFEQAVQGDLAAQVETGLADAVDAGLIADAVIAQDETQARAFWRVREEISAAQRGGGVVAKHDVSVAVSRVPEFIRALDAAVLAVCPDARIASFGHAGDGNIHYDVNQPQDWEGERFAALLPAITGAVYQVVDTFGGSISAEHGIGVARREDFARLKDPAALAAMRAIKSALDPKGILNPRVLWG